MNDPDILTYLLTSMNRSIYAGNVSDNNYPLDFSNNELSLYENVTLAIFLICLDLLTVVGNSFVVLAIIFDLHLRSPTHYLMGSLAIADFLIGMVILPFSSFQLFFNSWPFGSVFCTIWKTVDVLCCTASIYLLLAISVDRYIGVTRPLSYSSIITKKRVYMMIVFVWVLSLSVSLVGIAWKSPQEPTHLCEVNTDIGYSIFSGSLSYYIPLVFICIIYYRIYKEARNQMIFIQTGTKTNTDGKGNSVTLRVHRGPSSNQIKARCTCGKRSFNNTMSDISELDACPKIKPNFSKSHMMLSVPDSNSFLKVNTNKKKSSSASNLCQHCASIENNNVFNSAFSSKLAKFKREKKAAKNLALVVGCLVLCWMPFFIILPIEGLLRPNALVEKLLTIFFWLGYCNSAMNPLIYAYSSREFRRAYKGLIQCNIGELSKKENLEKLSRFNYNQIRFNRSNLRTNSSRKVIHNSKSEENSLISNVHSV